MHDPRIPSVDVATAAARLGVTGGPAARDSAPPALLVDVRERDEFAMLRVPGAALLPLSAFTSSYDQLPRDRPLLLLCAAGSRSGRATQYLLAQGFADVVNVEGGIVAWRAAGLPTRSGATTADEGTLPDPR